MREGFPGAVHLHEIITCSNSNHLLRDQFPYQEVEYLLVFYNPIIGLQVENKDQPNLINIFSTAKADQQF